MAFNAGDIEATLKLDRTPFTRELEAATREGNKLDGKTFNVTLDANQTRYKKAMAQANAAGEKFASQEYKAKFGADRSALAREIRSAQADVNKLGKTTAKVRTDLDSSGFRKGVSQVENEASKAGITVANKFSSPLRTIQWAAIFAGITAAVSAAPTALVALGGAVTALVGAFKAPISAIGAFNDAQEAMASGSDDAGAKVAEFEQQMNKLTPEGRAFAQAVIGMRDELGDFGKVMQTSTLPGFTQLLQASEKLIPSIEQGSSALGHSLSGVAAYGARILETTSFQHDLNDAFANSVPIATATGTAVINLGRDIVTYAARSKEQALGTAQAVDELSSGFTRFFQNLLPYQAQVGQLFAQLGGVTGDFVAEMGTMTGIVSGGAAPALASLRSMLQQVYEFANRLATGAMPGLSQGVSGAAVTVQALLAVLNPLAPLLGGLIGQVAPFIASMKLINTLSFGSFTKQWADLKTNVSDATSYSGKAGAALKGLASIGLSPAGIAAAGLGIALGELGKRQQMAQKAAEDHRQAVQGLTQAIVADKGAVGQQTQAYITQQLAAKNAEGNARALGISYGEVQTAASGNVGALNAMDASLQNNIKSLLAQSDIADRSNQANATAQDIILGAADSMNKYGTSADSVVNQVKGLTAEQKSQLIQTINLQAAIDGTAGATQEAVSAARQQQAAEQGVTTAVLDHYQALVKLNNELLGAVNKDLAYRTSLTNLADAQKAAADAVKQHGANSQEAQQAQEGEESAILGVIAAAGEKAKAMNSTAGADVQAAASAKAMNAEAVRLAGTYSGPLPTALEQYISGMDRSSAAAAGLIEGTNAAGEAVYRLPNGKEVKIAANIDEAMGNIAAFKTAADALHAQATLGVDIDPATQQVLDWKNTTSQTVGNTTTYTNTDPATGAVRQWTVTTDATGAKTTTYTTTDPATGAVQTWKRNTDGTWSLSHTDTDTGPALGKVYQLVRTTNGTWATVPVNANTSAAQGAINTFIHNNSGREVLITVRTNHIDGTYSSSSVRAQAIGHIVQPMARGGVTEAGWMAGGGVGNSIQPLANPSLAQLVPPGTPRVVGDRKDVKELYAPLDGSQRTKQLITSAAVDQKLTVPEMVRYMASGGIVGAAREVLNAIKGDKVDVFEDFSFRGGGDLNRQYSDQLAHAFYVANPGYDWGASDPGVVSSWLQSFIASRSAAASSSGTAPPSATQLLATSNGGASSSIDYTRMASIIAAAVASAIADVFAGGVTAYWDTDSMEKGQITLARRRAAR